MKEAFIFTGQGCQKEGMGLDLFQNSDKARQLFKQADEIIGETYSDVIFHGTEDVLMDTRNTQLAVFIYEVVVAMAQDDIQVEAMAGHSLGEYSALVVSGSISFEDGIKLIQERGRILYDAFKNSPGAMGAVIGLADDVVEQTLQDLREEYNEGVYVANYNGPGQLVIAGPRKIIKESCKRFLKLGAKRALLLPMKASGHNPSAYKEAELLNKTIDSITFKPPYCPIYQCADGLPHIDPIELKENIKKHLVQPVLWTSITRNMVKDGIDAFYEVGTDDTLQKIVLKMFPDKLVTSIWTIPTYKDINPYKIEEI